MNLLDRMKLPFRKSKEFLSALYDILGFYPHDIEIYRIAFSHKSLIYREAPATPAKGRRGKSPRRERPGDTGGTRPLNNERLEYLGDAVLETVVSDILFHHFDHKREGFLTSTRSKIVQRESLNRLATEMGLDRLVQAAEGTRMAHTNIGGNAFEALMGAIYLDRGYKYCQRFITDRVIGRYVDLDKVAQKEVNFKSKLLEWSQKNRIRINFRDNASQDERHGFTTVITVEGIVLGRGEGRAKKDSQQEASKEALTRMRQDAKLYDRIFRSKEKRTAMEAEESFALPRIDEIENELTRTGGRKGKEAARSRKGGEEAPVRSASDAAYDTAYDDTARYDVIDTPPATKRLTAADYAAKGLPAPPQENELDDTDELRAGSNRSRKGRKGDPKPAPGKERTERTERPERAQREGKTDGQQKPKTAKAAAPAATEERPAKETKPRGIQEGHTDKAPKAPKEGRPTGEAREAKPKVSEKPVREAKAPREPKAIAKPAPLSVTEREPAPAETITVAEERVLDTNTMTLRETVEEVVTNEPATAQEVTVSEKEASTPDRLTDSVATPSVTDEASTPESADKPHPDTTGEAGHTEAVTTPAPRQADDESPVAKDGATEDNKTPQGTTGDASPRPILRHISLDDFLFGLDTQEAPAIDDTTPDAESAPADDTNGTPSDEAAANDTAAPQEDEKKRPRSRNYRRRPARRKNDRPQGTTAE